MLASSWAGVWTAATILDRLAIHSIGALLAHTRKGVTAVYARWDKFGLRHEMAATLERELNRILSASTAKVPAAA